MTCGIYRVYNKVTGRFYIGQSRNIEKRFRHHKSCIKHPESSPQPAHYAMHEDYLKYGIESFAYEVLEECPVDQLDARESYWMGKFDVHNPDKSYHVNYHNHIRYIDEETEEKADPEYLTYKFFCRKDKYNNLADPHAILSFLKLYMTNEAMLFRNAEILDKNLKQRGYKSPINLEQLKNVSPLIEEYNRLLNQLEKVSAHIHAELEKVAGIAREDSSELSA